MKKAESDRQGGWLVRFGGSSSGSEDVPLSEYEQMRVRNIERCALRR
jgi:hypothetical protein